MIAMAACQTNNKTETANTADSVLATGAAAPDLKGLYRSIDFSSNEEPLFLYINFHNAYHVAGYDQHKGLKRNVSGNVVQNGDHWKLTLREPGDNPFDGVFELDIDTAGNGHGTWTPNDKQRLKPHKFSLVAVHPEDNRLSGYQGDHCDISFEDDGAVVMNYYPKTGDSTFALQMLTLRGAYNVKDTTVYLHWRNAAAGQPNADTMFLRYDGEGQDRYIMGVYNRDFEFYMGE